MDNKNNVSGKKKWLNKILLNYWNEIAPTKRIEVVYRACT